MVDWRGQIIKAQRRTNQLTNDGSNTGLFAAFIDASTGTDQSGKFIYAGGERELPLPMPFDSNTSWIRAIPESGSPVLAGYRADTNDPVCINYINTNPKDKLAAYDAGINLYKTLQPGEIEINSAGLAQSYYSIRPALEQRGGLVRGWLDQDRLESGAKAPIHTRQLWEYKSSTLTPEPYITPGMHTPSIRLLGDEERFGVVRRPYKLESATALATTLAADALLLKAGGTPPNGTLTYSYNYFDYPFPDYSIATGIIQAAVGATTATQTLAAAAQTAVAAGTKQTETRLFAKEYVRIINNPLYVPDMSLEFSTALTKAGIPLATIATAIHNPKLIDIREGQVFDDTGFQTFGKFGAYLRAAYSYFTPSADATSITIDEVGNIDWQLSVDAGFGWSVLIPTGSISFAAPLGSTLINNGLGIDLISGTTIGLTATTQDINLKAGGDINVICGGDSKTGNTVAFSHILTTNDYQLSVLAGNYSSTISMNMSLVAGADFSASSGATMALTAPHILIGTPTPTVSASATQAMVLGDLLTDWLMDFATALQTSAPVGNLGSPVAFSTDAYATYPAKGGTPTGLSSALTQLIGRLESLRSKSIKVSA